MLTHKFDVQNKHKLDNAQRRIEMPPHQTLERLGLKEGHIVADIGCGIGYFTIPAAEIVGASSKVYALDISEKMLEEVEKNALEAGVGNIIPIKTDELDFKVDNHSVDFSVLCNVFHEIDDKNEFVDEISRILKASGTLAIIEFQKKDSIYGPPIDHRLSCEEVSELLTKKGFTIEGEMEIGHEFYGITATKK